MTTKSYYDLLEIDENADIKTIKKAFHRLAKIYHPDISKDNSKFLGILKAYKYLLYEKQHKKEKELPRIILPKKRVEFAMSLKDIAKLGIFNRGKSKRRTGVYNTKGYDVKVYVKSEELKYNPTIFIDVPARVICPVCSGNGYGCNLCSGTGHVVKAVEIPFVLSSEINNNEIVEVELDKVKLRTYAFFLIKRLRVKVVII